MASLGHIKLMGQYSKQWGYWVYTEHPINVLLALCAGNQFKSVNSGLHAQKDSNKVCPSHDVVIKYHKLSIYLGQFILMYSQQTQHNSPTHEGEVWGVYDEFKVK